MTENTYRLFEAFARILLLVGGFVAFVISYSHYYEVKEREFKLNFWDEQIKACKYGASLSTKVALEVSRFNSVNSQVIGDLYAYSYGEARLFLNDKSLDVLEQIMRLAASCSHGQVCDYNDFNLNVLRFSQLCRDLISTSWDISLDAINDEGRHMVKLAN